MIGHASVYLTGIQTVDPPRSVFDEQGAVPSGQSHPAPLNSALVAFMYDMGARLPQIILAVLSL